MRTIFLLFLGLFVGPIQLFTSPALNDIESFQDLFRQGMILKAQGDFVESTRVLKHALTFMSYDRAPYCHGKCLLFIGLAKWNLGEMSAAVEQFEKAAKAFTLASDAKARDLCISCLNVARLYELGKDDRKSGLLIRAVSCFEQACHISREAGISDLTMKCLRQQALAYLDLRQFDLFLVNSKKGLDIAILIHNKVEQARCLNNIGVYYQWHNSLSEAIACYEKALVVLKDNWDQGTEAECFNNLGITLRELGDYDRAHFYLTKSLGLAQVSKDRQSIARGMLNIGSVFLVKGLQEHCREDLIAAFKMFQDVLNLGDGVAHPTILFAALNNMGLVQNELKNHEKARGFYIRALAIREIETGNPARQQTLSNIAASYLAEKNAMKALEIYRSSLASVPDGSAESSALGSYAGIGQCFELLGDEGAALLAYRRAIELTESMREKIPVSEIEMIEFSQNRLLPYEKAIRLLVHSYSKAPSLERLDEVFAVVEQMRARAFLESLNSANAFPPTEDAILKERLKAISLNLDCLKAKMKIRNMSLQTMEALRIEVKMEEETFVRLIQNSKANSITQSQYAQLPICRVSRVQPLLATLKAKMLEYFLGEEESYLITISAQSAAIHVLPSRRAVEEMLRPFLQAIADRTIDPMHMMEASKRITRVLIPLETARNANMIITVPDRILHYLPFETLVNLDASPNKYLVEEHAFVYCPSASSFVALNEMRPTKGPIPHKLLLAVGGVNYDSMKSRGNRTHLSSDNPAQAYELEETPWLSRLPFSRREIQDVSSVFPQNLVDTLVEDRATEANVKAGQLEDYRIIHFACHSLLNEHYPLRSALVLSRENGFEEDGYLQAREIYGLKFNADLVVLSACQTGKGIVEGSEGILDIARPFFFAGARSVLASLWSVDDEATRVLMVAFYRSLTEGKSVGEALGKAKREMVRSSLAHPYYWAGFILQGWPSYPGLFEQLPNLP